MTESTAEGFGHAKVILLGEHAVVHGSPALAAAIEGGFRAEARRGGGPSLAVPAWGVAVRPGDDDVLARALSALIEEAPPAARDATLVVEPRVPSRAGLGSSAALAVAAARALSRLAGEEPDDERVEAWAGRAEEVFHGAGRASGVDAAVACRGGALRFVRGERPRRLALGRPLEAVVAQVEPRAPTSEMVARVGRALEADPVRVRAIFGRIAALVDEAVAAAEAGDDGRLGALLDANHGLLAELDLATPRLEAACAAARSAGALGAKLTGAGGGGCIVALAPGRQEEVRAALAPLASWVAVSPLGGGRG